MNAARIFWAFFLLLSASCRHSAVVKEQQSSSDSLSLIAGRIALDFPFTGEQIDQKLKETFGSFTLEEKNSWESRNWLEWRIINGQKRYFSRAVSNLNLIRMFHETRDERDSAEARDPEMVHRKEHTQTIIQKASDTSNPVLPVTITINYTLTVSADAVPPGEVIRCWLPYPREDHPRQKNISLMSVSHDNYIIAPDSSLHRTIYMEQKSEKKNPAIFRISYSYESSGQYFDPDRIKMTSYKKDSELYRNYTREEPPHIRFSEDVKKLADTISGPGDEPFETVRKIYLWFSQNIPWAGAQEYSIIPDIPEYVITNRRGDCGMQTFLLMSMLRYKGIPVRWQSGWKVPPVGKNLHDWCEVWYEGTGWIPLDISYGLQYSDNRKTREFYMSGIDSYRLIINNGVSGRLYPEKRFMRSEPYDFQRGEVEWEGGNLYFDKWDYEMDIKYDEARE